MTESSYLDKSLTYSLSVNSFAFRDFNNITDYKAHLEHLLKCVHVLLHTVMRPQVGHKVAGIHPIKPMEECVHAGVKVDEIHLWNVS